MSNFKAKVEITTSPSAEGDEFIQSIPTGYWSDDSPIQPTRPEKRPRSPQSTDVNDRSKRLRITSGYIDLQEPLSSLDIVYLQFMALTALEKEKMKLEEEIESLRAEVDHLRSFLNEN